MKGIESRGQLTCLDTCDVLRYIFELDEESQQRVEQILKMDLIGRSIAEAVSENITGSIFRRAALTKEIPRVKLRKLLRSKHVRSGNIPARDWKNSWIWSIPRPARAWPTGTLEMRGVR